MIFVESTEKIFVIFLYIFVLRIEHCSCTIVSIYCYDEQETIIK